MARGGKYSAANLRLPILILMWYTSSIFQSIWAKTVLKKVPHPTTVTTAMMGATSCTIPILMTLWHKRRRTYSWRYMLSALVPLSMLKLVCSFSSWFTLLQVPVSYAHTVKAMGPVCSVVLTRLILKQRTSWKLCRTLLPIVAGVILASNSQPELNLFGLFSALSSTFVLSSQSIYSKKVMNKGMDHLNLLLYTNQISFVIILPIWFYIEGHSLTFGDRWSELELSHSEVGNVMLELLAAALCNVVQQIAAMTFLSLVQPVTFSVANASKRIWIIVLSIIYFQQSTSLVNALGMSLAVGGAFWYNNTKNKESETKKKNMLPTHSKPSKFYNPTII